ncbi:MAG: tRNA (guanine(10)-N(2))-dimethyltransferase [Promethearchaeota archaeon]
MKSRERLSHPKKLIQKTENNIKFKIYDDIDEKVPSKSMHVFYNEKMEINRDITSLGIKNFQDLYEQESVRIVETMAASGICAIRLLKEIPNIESFYINDINPYACKLIKLNLKLNNIRKKNVFITNFDANYLLLKLNQDNLVKLKESLKRPNVIMIDPFGTPNLYIDAVFKAIQKDNGLICITATDTAVLFGIKPITCMRKYMAKPIRVEYSKEIGARILLSFISRIANINKIGIMPLLTFYSNHFMRIFALTFKGKKKINNSLKNHGYIVHCFNCENRMILKNNILEVPAKCSKCGENKRLDFAGPLWIEEIHDKNFVENLIILNQKSNFRLKRRLEKILRYMLEEINMPISYYNIHKLSKELNLKAVPKISHVIERINKEGFKASRTHFDFLSIKTTADKDSIIRILETS